MIRTSFIAGLLLSTFGVHAHHGTAAQFDQSKSMQVVGTVTNIRFVNPHSYVYFDVLGEANGVQNWRCEMRAGTALKRSGWTEDMFAPGTRIKIDGAPAFREPNGCYVNTITFDDGEILERYDQLEAADSVDVARDSRRPNGTPNFSGTWAAPQRLPTLEQVREIAFREGPDNAGRSIPLGFEYQLTDTGELASAGYKREDNPRFHCQAQNILADWTFDQHINQIDQDENSIRLTYGYMSSVRTIHLDLGSHPKDIIPSRTGHSIGHWDGDTLVVDTIGFAEGYIDTNTGGKHSSKLHIVERFTLSDDGTRLNRSYIGNDPLYLTGSFDGQDSIISTASSYDPYDCEDLTTEIIDGY